MAATQGQALVWVVLVCALLAVPNSADLLELRSAAHQIAPWLVKTRREFHQFPELMFEEHKTSEHIRSLLKEMDVHVSFPYAKTGVVGRIGKGKPVVALRADIDALPVQEPEGVDYRSKNNGRMHACGHDGKYHVRGACWLQRTTACSGQLA
jgi:metal-dependent amidase/aminoacylase/carboxypeptidase family protein